MKKMICFISYLNLFHIYTHMGLWVCVCVCAQDAIENVNVTDFMPAAAYIVQQILTSDNKAFT